MWMAEPKWFSTYIFDSLEGWEKILKNIEVNFLIFQFFSSEYIDGNSFKKCTSRQALAKFDNFNDYKRNKSINMLKQNIKM